MHTFHWNELHFPKGPNLRLIAKSAVWAFAACLVMFVVFTAFGGIGFAETMGGLYGFSLLVVGLIASGVVAYLERDPS